MAYYKRIRELREDHDMTQRQVAAYLNMPQPQYFRYEQGYWSLVVEEFECFSMPCQDMFGLVRYDLNACLTISKADDGKDPRLMNNGLCSLFISQVMGDSDMPMTFGVDTCHLTAKERSMRR